MDADKALDALLQEQPSTGAALYEGAMRGASLGWAPKMEAGWTALAKRLYPKSLGGTDLSLGQQYAQDLAAVKGRGEAAKTAHPDAYTVAEFGGGAVPAMVGTVATGGAGALPMALGQGAVAGAGYSDADTAGGLGRDSLIGAGVGGLGYGAGALLGKALSRLRGFAASRVGQAAGRATEQATKEEGAKVASLAGKYGGELQKGSRFTENVGRLEPSMTAPQAAELAAQRASGEIPALEQQVAGSTLKNLPGQAATIAAKEAELRAAQQALPQAIASRTAELSKPSLGADALSFAKSYAEPLVWGVAGQQGAKALGLDPKEQAMVGAIAGGIGGRTRAGKALAYRLNRPGNQQAMWGAVEGAAPAAGTLFRNAIAATRVPAAAGAVGLMATARKRSEDNATLDALLKQDGSDAAIDALLKQ